MGVPGGLAGVLASFGPEFLAHHPLSVPQARAWRAIRSCRTPALGGQVERCDTCGQLRYRHHSCRNRHCPQCQTRAKEAWIAARRTELLPVPYFHLVFTLPHALNALAGRALYEQLFAAAAATLASFAANPRWLGGEMAYTLVLHTWQQDLSRHLHVHALVAGGALAPDGTWKAPKPGFLFPVRALSKVFRGRFLAGLEQDRERWRLAPEAWQALNRKLREHDWVVYAKQPLGGPEQVLEYLGRYTHRVALSNERLLGIAGDDVLLRVRAGTDGKKRTLRLPGVELIRRFLLHVLPKGFKRIRHYGLLSPARKAQALAAARTALALPPPQPAVVESVADFLQRVAGIEGTRCPHCGRGTMRFLQAIPRTPPPEPWPRAPP